MVDEILVRNIPAPIGVYALCDLDGVPVYVGQSGGGKSGGGIRERVRRHLTSARSDVIANREIDIWEIAYVWAWPTDKEHIPTLEAHLFHEFDTQKRLMNGSVPKHPGVIDFEVPERLVTQVLNDAEIAARLKPEVRLARQVQHYEALLDHILQVKNVAALRRSLAAHYERLRQYHDAFLGPPGV